MWCERERFENGFTDSDGKLQGLSRFKVLMKIAEKVFDDNKNTIRHPLS